MRIFEGFKFSKQPTPIHNMDPRAKFILIAVIFIIALLYTDILVLILAFIIQIPIVALAKATRRWLASLRGAAMLGILIFVMNFITGSTLGHSLSMMLRFAVLVSSFSLFFMTTSPDDLGLALESIGVPYTLTFTFTTAVRLVPTMATDAQTVIDAQKSRGLELEKGNLIKRVRNYIPILIPLIVSAIRRSIELAEALESRGFGASEKRESMVILKLRKNDLAVLIISISALTLALYAKFYLTLPTIEIPYRLPKILPFFG